MNKFGNGITVIIGWVLVFIIRLIFCNYSALVSLEIIGLKQAPSFLIQHLANNHFYTPDLEQLQSDSALLSAFDIEYISNEALLFQTGYLTIHKVEEPLLGHWLYTLGYPNHEVKSSLNARFTRCVWCE